MTSWRTYEVEGQMSLFGPDSWCGKTSPEPLVRESQKEQTFKPSSRKSSKSSVQTLPMFLYLKTGSGASQEVLWVTERTDSRFPSPTDYTMHSFGESPKEENVSRLSQILEVGPLPKYYLSAKACQEILTRADRRGKELPKLLKETLMQQATPSKLGGGAEFDRYGRRAGKGALIQEELSGTLGVSQDQTLICLNDQQAVMVYGLDRASFNQGKNAQYDFSVEEDLAQTVLAKGPGGVMTRQ